MTQISLPPLSLPGTGGHDVVLSDLLDGILILYFYPKDNTPGCTTEGLDFSRLSSEFEAAGARVVGVSRDSVKSHEGFKAKHCFPFTLLSDSEEKLCAALGVIKMKNMYGKQVRGIERSTFVFSEDGKLLREWRGVKVNGHAQEVLDFVRSL